MGARTGVICSLRVKHQDSLPCVSLQQAAGAIDVPIQGFTLYINEIKESSVTVEQCFHLCSAQLAMLHFPSKWQTVLYFRLMNPSVIYSGRQRLALYATHYVLYKHMYTYNHSYVSCKNFTWLYLTVGQDIHKTH